MTEFHDLVKKLTRPHPVIVPTDDGPRIIQVNGLIQQLRDEVGGTTSVGDGAGGKHKLPLNAPALDTLRLIEKQIHEVAAAGFSVKTHQPATVEGSLARWAASVQENQLVRYTAPWPKEPPASGFFWAVQECSAIDLLRRWTRSIEELFAPPRNAEITAACIQCGVREVWRARDGQMVNQAALVFVRDRQTGDSTHATCQACGAVWHPFQFLFLAEQIAANEKRDTTNVNI